MLLFQHPVLVLVFKLKLCIVLPGGWVVDLFFSLLSFSGAAWSAPPSVGCGSLSLYVVLRSWNQLCSPPTILLWSWVFTVLVYWGLVSLPRPLYLGQGQRSVSQLPAVNVLWWFADCFSILQCRFSLGVAHWLRRGALWTPTCPISGSGLSLACYWPFCLSSHLFTEACT
jgi:hypothetical protein